MTGKSGPTTRERKLSWAEWGESLNVSKERGGESRQQHPQRFGGRYGAEAREAARD